MEIELKECTETELEVLEEKLAQERMRRKKESIKPLALIPIEDVIAIAEGELEASLKEEENDDRCFVEAIMTLVYGEDVYRRIHELVEDV